MGSYWLRDKLKEIRRAKDVQPEGNSLIRLQYDLAGGGTKSVIGYLPSPDEYLVGKEVVDKAKGLGADWLIAEPWCHLSIAAQSYGRTQGVHVVGVSQFLRMIENGNAI